MESQIPAASPSEPAESARSCRADANGEIQLASSSMSRCRDRMGMTYTHSNNADKWTLLKCPPPSRTWKSKPIALDVLHACAQQDGERDTLRGREQLLAMWSLFPGSPRCWPSPFIPPSPPYSSCSRLVVDVFKSRPASESSEIHGFNWGPGTRRRNYNQRRNSGIVKIYKAVGGMDDRGSLRRRIEAAQEEFETESTVVKVMVPASANFRLVLVYRVEVQDEPGPQSRGVGVNRARKRNRLNGTAV
ncbi:hypothetical protein DFH06DRAFT_1137598 [Mycena polygramma]|nr:hypothetical protein DFH06DRAFT_1137598 [Mycena polygramma]